MPSEMPFKDGSRRNEIGLSVKNSISAIACLMQLASVAATQSHQGLDHSRLHADGLDPSEINCAEFSATANLMRLATTSMSRTCAEFSTTANFMQPVSTPVLCNYAEFSTTANFMQLVSTPAFCTCAGLNSESKA